MFYNELSAKYLFWTCQWIHSVFSKYFRNYLAAVSTYVSHKWPIYIVGLFETRTPLHAFCCCSNCLFLLYYTFWEFRNSYFQETILKTIIWVVVKSMKPACETASYQKCCRPAVAMLCLLRSPVEIPEFSCGKNCWRCSTKGTRQCNFIKCLSILIERKHKKMCPFIEKWVDCNCHLAYNNLYALL